LPLLLGPRETSRAGKEVASMSADSAAAGRGVLDDPRDFCGGTTSGAVLPDRVAATLREMLKLSRDQELESERVLELLPDLLRLALVVDTVAWGAWKQKFAGSTSGTVRPAAPLQRVVRAHLAGEGGGAGIELERLRELVRAMVSGVAQCGGEVACRVMRSLSPADIEAEVGGGGLRGRDAECWRAYKARAERLDGGAIEREVTGVLARFVEKWMRHADAGSRAF